VLNGSADRAGYAWAGLTMLIWASFVWISRVAGLSPMLPQDLTALRFGAAALVLLPAWFFWKRVPLLDARLLVLALVGGIAYALLVYAGFRFAPAAHGALLVSGLLPFTMALMAYLVLGETPRRQMKRGLLLIALGVACLAADTLRHGGGVVIGDVLLVGASLAWALYTVLVRRYGFGAWETTIGVALVATAIYLPVYLFLLPKGIREVGYADIALQAVFQGIFVVVIAMVLYMKAMALLGPVRLGSVMAMTPALAGVGVSLLLGEPLTLLLVAGLLLTSSGAWVGSRA
jgi:drug/metabolite transporter (DMT)-like permease